MGSHTVEQSYGVPARDAFRVPATSFDGSKTDTEAVLLRVKSFWHAFQSLDDGRLRGKTEEFRRRLSAGETLDGLFAEAFAVVCESARRILGVTFFDVQLLGGLILHQGQIAEMATGEGKTFVASLPAYLHGLTGRGIHVITVNDYLARRDRDWLGPLYGFLGLSAGCVVHGMARAERRRAYRCDITYGSNKEFGFDYLRDNLPQAANAALEQALNSGNIFEYLLHGSRPPPGIRIQRELHHAIIDEADSVLIDEARTPLVLSGPQDRLEGVRFLREADALAQRLEAGTHFRVQAHERAVLLTDAGKRLADREQPSGMSSADWRNAVVQAVRARRLFTRDKDYIIRAGEALIVDAFTGRALEGRVWQAGLHQAIEFKEGLARPAQNRTLISITYQNYFRKYAKLSGMTGTAATEAREFQEVYGLKVVHVPTNRPVRRVDHGDRVFSDMDGKYAAIADEVETWQRAGRPILVGTVSVASSERMSALLGARRIPHRVLNAKQDRDEAAIVANAGRSGAVTIATNMAGRGTDILLGGNLNVLACELVESGEKIPAPSDGIYRRAQAEAERQHRYGLIPPDIDLERYARALAHLEPQVEADRLRVLELGGLLVLGSERHESRRIDNQLRGRAGRQGDPGSSQFFVSLEDDIIRLFLPAEWRAGLRGLARLLVGAPGRLLARHGATLAQRRAERHNFKARKKLLRQSEAIQKWRESPAYDELADRWKERLV
jgi:preprotein translocase subunit SecA